MAFGIRCAARALLPVALVAAFALLVPALALAHLERPSYWPDPRPDTGVTPPAGGEVPTARSLGSAVTGKGPGEVRVVCKGRGGRTSLANLARSARAAHTHGFRIRPSQPLIPLSNKRAKRLVRMNRAFAEHCKYHQIQAAVADSGNNDRVVVMPGRYREQPSREQPTNDPRCADLIQDNGNGALAPSYRYQTTCPNDQNLIYIQGRAVPDEPPPSPPLEEREGIPDLGPCLRCNFQLEGSGVKPTDVIMDAGMNYTHKGPGARPGQSNGCNSEPECSYAKDVVLRVDRADGFVARNFETTSSTEHGIYVEEVDGYFLDKVKMYWSGEYGNLTFTSDHGLYNDCDAYGAGDAAIYPGAAPETGAGVEDKEFYPDAPRINTVVQNCDMRGSALAYSGSQGNAVRITHNEIYGNTTGVVTDSVSASGHPGYPADSIEVDHNNIYSNNLNSYVKDPPFLNTVGLPIGVGIMWPGVNLSTVHDNHIFDNWRNGTMLIAVPEAALRGTAEDRGPGICPNGNPEVQTSCENQYYDNVMGQAPPGFKPSAAVGKFGNPNSLDDPGVRNGVDFWWDEFPDTLGNCWRGNVGPDGTRASLTSDPPLSPVPNVNLPTFLPEACSKTDPTYALGVGTGDVVKETTILICGTMVEDGDTSEDQPSCEWLQPPPEPGGPVAARAERKSAEAAQVLRRSDLGRQVREHFHSISTVGDRR